MRQLHLVRRHDDAFAWHAIQSSTGVGSVKVVLLQDAVGDPAPAGLEVIVLQADGGRPEAREAVDYDGLVELMEWADKVVVW
jgi:hypothetical protein